MGAWAVAHGSQLGRGGACTFLIPQRMHELVTQTLVWFSSGRACVKPKIVQNIPVGQNGIIFQYDSWYNKTRCLIAFKFSHKNLHKLVLQMVWLSSSRTSLQKCANHACFENVFFSLQIVYHVTSIRDALPDQIVCFFEHCSNGLCPPPPLVFEHLCCGFF